MLLEYTGSRQYIATDFYHKRYAFSKENNFTCDVQDKAAILLLRTGQYKPVVEVVEVEKEIKEEKGFACKKCGKVCKSKFGLMSHSKHCK